MVVNRAAGRAHVAGRIAARLASDRPGLDCAETRCPGDAERIAREGRGYDGLMVVGGDGTISECLTGMDLPRQKLAILPAGHGMCLARDLGLHRPDAAFAALRASRWRELDVMDVDVERGDLGTLRRRCGSTLAVGYVTDVVAAGRRRFPGFGHAAYALASFVTRPRRFAARTDPGDGAPGDRREWTGIVVNNTAHLANFRAFASARVDDGLLDVMWQDCGWMRQQAHNLAVLAGSTTWGPYAMQQSAALELRLAAPRTLMADGELLSGVHALRVTCRRAAVSCLVGAP